MLGVEEEGIKTKRIQLFFFFCSLLPFLMVTLVLTVAHVPHSSATSLGSQNKHP